MRSPTRTEGPNAQSKVAATDELTRPAQTSDDAEETQAISRAPSETTEVTATARVVDLRPQRPRRNYTWLNPSNPPPPANRRDEGAPYPDEGQRPAPDPLAHLPPGERPGIVRVREVRRDYEYHYEYIYEEVVPRQAAQLPPAAPQPPQLPPAAPPVGQPATPLAAPPVLVEPVVVEPRYSERPVAAAVPVATATAFAAAEVAPRLNLASRAGPAALIAMGAVLIGLATAFFVSTRSASHAASVAAKPAAVEAPTAAPPPTPPPAAPVAITSAVASAATPEPVAAASASGAKPNKHKKPPTPQH